MSLNDKINTTEKMQDKVVLVINTQTMELKSRCQNCENQDNCYFPISKCSDYIPKSLSVQS